jgi:hypothetical protein
LKGKYCPLNGRDITQPCKPEECAWGISGQCAIRFLSVELLNILKKERKAENEIYPDNNSKSASKG